MTGYVFDKHTLIIHTIVENVSFVDDNADNDGKIIGENTTSIFSGGSEYIILQNPIELVVGDKIDVAGMDDSRDYFLKTKEEWFHEQLRKQDEKMKEQQDKMERLLQLLEVKEE